MPKYLVPELVDDQPDWSLASGAPQPYAVHNPTTPPRAQDLATTFQIVVHDRRKTVPDIGVLRGTATPVISRRMRDVIEAFEPGVHHYMPVNITLRDGATLGGHYLFKVGSFTNDAIDAENSTVSPVRIAGQVRLYNERRFPADLTWKASAVRGRHIWSDRLMPSVLMVSDVLFAAIVQQGIGGYVHKESRLNAAL